MNPPDVEPFEFSHTLVAADFHDASSAVLRVVLDRATDGYVGIDHDELEMGLPDAPRCRATWEEVRDSLSWCDDRHPGAWYHGALPETSETFERLWSLEDGNSGAFFLHTLILSIGDEPLLFAVPHHSIYRLEAPDESFVAAVDDALAGKQATALPSTPDIEWSAGERAYRLTGTVLCVRGGGLRERGCYHLTNLRRLEANPETLSLSLDWKAKRPTDGLTRVLSELSPLVSDPPDEVYFEERETMCEIVAVIRERLDVYYE